MVAKCQRTARQAARLTSVIWLLKVSQACRYTRLAAPMFLQVALVHRSIFQPRVHWMHRVKKSVFLQKWLPTHPRVMAKKSRLSSQVSTPTHLLMTPSVSQSPVAHKFATMACTQCRQVVGLHNRATTQAPMVFRQTTAKLTVQQVLMSSTLFLKPLLTTSLNMKLSAPTAS